MYYTSSSIYGNPNKKLYSKSNPYCQDFFSEERLPIAIPCLATENGSFITTENGSYIAAENDNL